LIVVYQKDTGLVSPKPLAPPKPVNHSVHHVCPVRQVRQSLQGPGEKDGLVVGTATLVAGRIGLTGAFPTERRVDPSPAPEDDVIGVELAWPAVGQYQVVGAQAGCGGVFDALRVCPVHIVCVTCYT